MTDFLGIIFAYKKYPELRELVQSRTSASLPVCGRYRLIDFALSSMRNAGITDVGVVMQQDYQSLLDHLGSGKPWDMSKHSGGLRMLPPFGLPDYHKGNYAGTMEALIASSSYIKDMPQNHVVLLLGGLCGNIDLEKACSQHLHSDAGITAICGNYQPDIMHHRYIIGSDGYISGLLYDRMGPGEGVPSLEGYIIDKDLLLELIDTCRSQDMHRFHQDAISMYLARGGKMLPYMHTTYARFVRTVDGYFAANMDMLDPVNRAAVFPADRPVLSKFSEGVSTYYGTESSSINSLVADNCIIEGSIENCIVFPDVHIGPGASLKDCIILKGTRVGAGAILDHIIADKDVTVSPNITLLGNAKLPIVIPKGAEI